MAEIVPPPDLIPRDLAEARIAIGKLQVICQNQETKLSEQDGEIADVTLKLQQVTADFAKLATQLSVGWKMIAGLGAFTLGITYLLYNLKNVFGHE